MNIASRLFLIGVATHALIAEPAPSPSPEPDQSIPARRAQLSARVSSLRREGGEGAVRSVLEVALERAKACEQAGCAADAQSIMNDVKSCLATPESQLTAPGTNTATVSAIRLPQVTSGNPYLERLLAGARKELAAPDKPWQKNTPFLNNFKGAEGENGSRSVGEKMCAWLWLYDNPASPLKGDPEVLARFLRLAHAYADALDVHGADPSVQRTAEGIIDSGPRVGQGIFDDFALAPASSALREFSQLHPGLLLPFQKSQWNRAMANGGRIIWGKAKDRQGDYANIDIALSLELLNFGLYLHNAEYLEKSRFLAEVQRKNLYPDGAIAYKDHQNESNNYHDADTHYLARIYEITGNQKVLDVLRCTEWYGPVTSGRVGEFWTVPSWKDTWNSMGAPAGGEEVASITGNTYLRGMRDIALSKVSESEALKAWYQNYAPLPWFRNDVKSRPLPDNYTAIDRNIAGPRAWYGRFTYATSLRSVPEGEAGLATLMGAQLTDTNGGFGQILMGVYPRIREKSAELTRDGKFDRSSFAWRTHGMKSALVTGRSWSAVMADYRLQQYRSSSPGKPVDWLGKQLWLGLPDRIIGLVEITPSTEGAMAVDVEGVLRLGTGGTVNGKPVKIRQTGTNSWSYGDLEIIMHAHNGATVETKEVPFRLPKFPNTEIRVMDEKGAAGASSPTGYPASFNQWFFVEIRPSWVTTQAVASLIEGPAGILGFKVAVDTKKLQLMVNPLESKLSFPLSAEPGSSLHDSSVGIVTPLPSNVNLNPRELAVLVTSSSKEDHLPGWVNYQEMLGQLFPNH